MNRSLSIRSRKADDSPKQASKHRFTLSSLRGNVQPELSKKLYKLIKSENYVISAYETAGKESVSVASQLSDWGEATGDDTVSEISDKLGVLLAEIGEQEDVFAQNLEDARAVLKQIRNTESSVQPSRDKKSKIADDIGKLKLKEPQSTKLVQFDQELVRAEAENLVAEAQLTNITRQKFKEAYDHHLAAVIERAEKQIILARHGRQLLNLLDDTPVVPGDTRGAFSEDVAARNILSEAEDELRSWQQNIESISYAGNHAVNALPAPPQPTQQTAAPAESQSTTQAAPSTAAIEFPDQPELPREGDVHPAYRENEAASAEHQHAAAA